MLFFTSDLYLGSDRVAERRHFSDATSMNNRIIENWNSIVNPSDKVFILGGVGEFEFLLSLNGEKTIMMSSNEDDTYRRYIESTTTELDDSYNTDMFESHLCSLYYVNKVIFSRSILKKDYSGRLLRLSTDRCIDKKHFTVFGGVNESERLVDGGINSNIFVNGMFPMTEVDIEEIIKHISFNN